MYKVSKILFSGMWVLFILPFVYVRFCAHALCDKKTAHSICVANAQLLFAWFTFAALPKVIDPRQRPFTTSQYMTIVTLCYCNLCSAMFASLLAPFFPTQVTSMYLLPIPNTQPALSPLTARLAHVDRFQCDLTTII